MVFEGAGNGMATIAFDGPRTRPDPAGQRRVLPDHWYTPDQLLGTRMVDFLRDEEPDQTRHEIEQAAAGNGTYRFERIFSQPSGNEIWLGGTAAIVEARRRAAADPADPDRRRDRTQGRRARAQRHHAAHDPLTGLPNRRLLQHRFASSPGADPTPPVGPARCYSAT